MNKQPYDLKPCPFCGGKAKFTDPDWESGYNAYISIVCSNCGVRTKPVTLHIMHQCGGIGSKFRKPYELMAVERWNKRT